MFANLWVLRVDIRVARLILTALIQISSEFKRDKRKQERKNRLIIMRLVITVADSYVRISYSCRRITVCVCMCVCVCVCVCLCVRARVRACNVSL